MFNFGGITHISDNGKGAAPGYNFSLCGSVSSSMMDLRPATSSDIMGGRAFKAPDGSLMAPYGRKWETVQQILEEAAKHPEVKLCSAPGCSCRRLF